MEVYIFIILFFRWFQNGVQYKFAVKDMLEVPMAQVVFRFALNIVIMVNVWNLMSVNANQDLAGKLVQNVSLYSKLH